MRQGPEPHAAASKVLPFRTTRDQGAPSRSAETSMSFANASAPRSIVNVEPARAVKRASTVTRPDAGTQVALYSPTIAPGGPASTARGGPSGDAGSPPLALCVATAGRALPVSRVHATSAHAGVTPT